MRQVYQNVTTLLKGSLFLLGIIIFFFSSCILIKEMGELLKGEPIGGVTHMNASEGEIQIAILKHAFVMIVFIGLEIISLLMLIFFKDWNKGLIK